MFNVFMFGGVVCFSEKCEIRLTNLDKYFIGAVSSFRVYCNDVLTQNEVNMFKQVESLL